MLPTRQEPCDVVPEPQCQQEETAAHGELPVPAEQEQAAAPGAAPRTQTASAKISEPPGFQQAPEELILDAAAISAPAPIPAPKDRIAPSSAADERPAPIASPWAEPRSPVLVQPIPVEQPVGHPAIDRTTDTATAEPCSAPITSAPVHPPGSDAIEPLTPPIPARKRIAVHRDRRGARRADPRQIPSPLPLAEARPVRQTEAKLRLAIDLIRRNVALSLVLVRPEGFPETVEIDFNLNGPQTAAAYDAARYDDIDLVWTPELLVGELRILDARQRLEWLRSSRDIHLFAPSELDLVSVSAARVGVEYAIICQQHDAAGVAAAAESAGSSPLTIVDDWKGVPPGWTILCGYTPAKPIPALADQRLSGLDPGSGTEIELRGGLRIRAQHFAEGHVPRIIIEPLPPRSRVLIGGRPASQDDTGAWISPDWDDPGSHLIDVVGGPSLTYTIESDPGTEPDWPIPSDALSPFGMPPPVPAVVIGALVQPLSRQTLLATEPAQTVIALGFRAGAQALVPRTDAPAAIAALAFEAVFLIISSGARRRQGRVLWLGPRPSGNVQTGRRPDMVWVSTVLAASARRLDVYPSQDDAKRAWRSAVAAARRWRRQKT